MVTNCPQFGQSRDLHTQTHPNPGRYPLTNLCVSHTESSPPFFVLIAVLIKQKMKQSNKAADQTPPTLPTAPTPPTPT